jgi:FAD-dependent monooxygenase
MMLIHFKSRDLNYLRRHGQFWHNFVSSGVALIAQDEVDTWTVHLAVPLDAKLDDFDPIEKIQTSLGGEFGAVPIKVDKILVKSFWRPNICIAKSFISPKGRAFLVGDAAHQNIPAGGYGMNTAVGDAFDIGWKVAAAVKGYAGAGLLQSYEEERKPVATRNIDRSGRHWSQLAKFWEMSTGTNGVVAAQTDEGKALRARIDEYMTTHDGENREHGIEMGYRYNGSSVIVPSDDPSKEPRWDYRQYVPSTWPGARAPHVFLEDGKTSVFSVLGQGPDYSLVDFSPDARFINKFKPAFESLGIPWVPVHLPNEPTVRKIWEREAVLVRPDQHVAWRTGETPTLDFDEREILATVIGLKSELGGVSEGGPSLTEGQGFLAVIGKAQPIGEGEHNDKYAAFQR